MHIEWLLACEFIIAVGFITIGEMDYRYWSLDQSRGSVFYKVGFVALVAFVASLAVWMAGPD